MQNPLLVQNPNHHRLEHHFTASGIVVWQSHVLLVNHKRIGAWVPPGGHIELEEMPEQTVVREMLEETGLAVEVLSQPIPKTDDPDAFFLASPLYVQSVLAVEGGCRFYHVDLAYLCRPVEGVPVDKQGLPLLKSNHEVKAASWIPLADAQNLTLAKNVEPALKSIKNQELIGRFSVVACRGALLDNACGKRNT